MNTETKVAISIGGNIGNVILSFDKALSQLQDAGLKEIKKSYCYYNKPVGCVPNTPFFYNCAISGYWFDTPMALLNICQDIEENLGRSKEHKKNSSRTVDLDIVIFGSQIINMSNLKVPHPKVHKRLFVILPLNDIEPEMNLPHLNKTIQEVLLEFKNLDSEEYYEFIDNKMKW